MNHSSSWAFQQPCNNRVVWETIRTNTLDNTDLVKRNTLHINLWENPRFWRWIARTQLGKMVLMKDVFFSLSLPTSFHRGNSFFSLGGKYQNFPSRNRCGWLAFPQNVCEERDNRKPFLNAVYQKINITVLSCGNLRYFIPAVMGDAMHDHALVPGHGYYPSLFDKDSGLPRTASALCPVPRRKSRPVSWRRIKYSLSVSWRYPIRHYPTTV